MEQNDLNPFGTFDQKILQEDTPQREYAITGKPVATEETTSPEIDRVEFDFSKFDNPVYVNENSDEESLESEKSQTEFNQELGDPDEIALNKKVQAKLAKGQAKNIAGIYVMILKATWKWLAKYREDKIQVMHIRGELDMNVIIRNHPFIEHIREMNNEVDTWEMDSDSIEAIVDALEIYLISQNIQTSPGMNLAMAMGVPAIEMLAKAWGHKREIKSLVTAVAEMHQQDKKKQRMAVVQEQNEMNSLREEIEQLRMKNQSIMNASVEPSKPTEAVQPASQRTRPLSRSAAKKPAKKDNPFKQAKNATPVVKSNEKLKENERESTTE